MMIRTAIFLYSTKLAQNQLFQIIIDIFIMVNTIILSTKGMVEDSHIKYSNYTLNIVLIFEMSLKLLINPRWFV